VRFDLGDLILDDGTRQLLRGEEELHLSPKAFDFLALLVRERPRVVTKIEMHQRLWAGVFVSDASVAMVASEARAALGESARAPRRIRTVHGHGYAFQGDVRPVVSGTAPALSHWLVVDGRILPLREGDNIVGREPGVDVWIDGPNVSRRHACLRVTPANVTLEDLSSKNGTFVGDTRVTASVVVANGDAVRFGSTPSVYRQSADPTVGEGET
jgi:DNA-binding winged helix-turn-helix (wHTH) protein